MIYMAQYVDVHVGTMAVALIPHVESGELSLVLKRSNSLTSLTSS